MKKIYLIKQGHTLPKELLKLPCQTHLPKNQRLSIVAGMDILIFKQNKKWHIRPAKINQEGSLIYTVRAKQEQLNLLFKFTMKMYPSIKN